MNAKELHDELRGGGRMWVEGASEDEEDTILRALSLLAAAEANDGTTPETDEAVVCLGCVGNESDHGEWVEADFARALERERKGLAAEVLRLRSLLPNDYTRADMEARES